MTGKTKLRVIYRQNKSLLRNLLEFLIKLYPLTEWRSTFESFLSVAPWHERNPVRPSRLFRSLRSIAP